MVVETTCSVIVGGVHRVDIVPIVNIVTVCMKGKDKQVNATKDQSNMCNVHSLSIIVRLTEDPMYASPVVPEAALELCRVHPKHSVV